MVNGFVDGRLMSNNKRTNDSIIDHESASVLTWNHQPQQKDAFVQSVKRNPEKQVVAEKLQNAEQSVHTPVHQPFRVIVFNRRLDRFHSFFLISSLKKFQANFF